LHTRQEVWRGTMSTKNFEATPTPSESISLDTISKESVKDAWKEYEAKPEYKEFNKHDMIESMQPQSKQKSSS
jgi:hypothetical protein